MIFDNFYVIRPVELVYLPISFVSGGKSELLICHLMTDNLFITTKG